MKQGVVYIVYGDRARQAARESLEGMRRHHPALPVLVLGEDVPGAGVSALELDAECLRGMTGIQKSRWTKVRMHQFCPFDETLYIDADTRVYQPLDAGFDILADGWDVAIAHSTGQGNDLLWHIGAEERDRTLYEIGCGCPLQLQGGVFFWRKNDRTRHFFDTWQEEWERWQDQDQGALLRALNRAPVRTWLLGRPWNGGAMVGHIFGRARK